MTSVPFGGNLATDPTFRFREEWEQECSSAAKCLALRDLDLRCADQIMRVLIHSAHQIDVLQINLPHGACLRRLFMRICTTQAVTLVWSYKFLERYFLYCTMSELH